MLTSLSPTVCSSRFTSKAVSLKPLSCQRPRVRPVSGRQRLVTRAELGGGENEGKGKAFITADEEPDEFFQSKAEKAGGLAPLKDPIAIVGILGILLPFVILGIAIGTGYVDVAPKMPKY